MTTLARDIGPPPAYLAPVPDPQPRPGQRVIAHAAERGAALDRANAIIACTDAEWRATRAAFLSGERSAKVARRECPALDRVRAKARRR